LFFDQDSTEHVLHGLQRIANILSTEAPTEIGGNFGVRLGKKVRKNRNLGWVFFDHRLAGLDWRGVQGWANTLSTDSPTGIVGKNARSPVGAAARCDLLIRLMKDRKIAASFHSTAPTGDLWGVSGQRLPRSKV
jgi:hypothetical protein